MNKFAKMIDIWNPHNERASIEDKLTFGKWERGEITTRQAINNFLRRNNIERRETIDVDDFELWLNSLGYFRSLTRRSAENPYK